MTLDVTGALPAGYDDGAITLNYAGTTSSGNADADWLLGNEGGDGRWNFKAASGNVNMSCACWVKPTASANTWLGGIIAAFNTVAGSPSYDAGWALYMSWPTRALIFFRGGAGPSSQTVSAGVLPADTWSHVAATYDGTNMRIYVDGGLAATAASGVDLPALNQAIEIGSFPPALGSYRGRFYGSIDEAAVWHKTLTGGEIALLAGAGVDQTAGAAADEVWTADGSGGTSWEYPTIAVTY
jgi:hypothetical protein